MGYVFRVPCAGNESDWMVNEAVRCVFLAIRSTKNIDVAVAVSRRDIDTMPRYRQPVDSAVQGWLVELHVFGPQSR